MLQGFAELGGIRRKLLDGLLVLAEDDLALQHRNRIVEMHDRTLGTTQGLIGLADQMLTRLGQHHYRHIIRDEFTFDQQTDEVIIR